MPAAKGQGPQAPSISRSDGTPRKNPAFAGWDKRWLTNPAYIRRLFCSGEPVYLLVFLVNVCTWNKYTTNSLIYGKIVAY